MQKACGAGGAWSARNKQALGERGYSQVHAPGSFPQQGQLHVIARTNVKVKCREGNQKRLHTIFWGKSFPEQCSEQSHLPDTRLQDSERRDRDGVFRLEESASAEQGSWGSGKKREALPGRGSL